MNNNLIGIIRGEGSGNLLADIFIDFLTALASKHDKQIAFQEDFDPETGKVYTYHSFNSLKKKAGDDLDEYKKISKIEADRLAGKMDQWYHENGIRAVFRTSVNAEALYRFRQKVKAAKEFLIKIPGGRRILFIRDEAEGFYANSKYDSSEEEIVFCGKFTKKHQQGLARCAIRRADQRLREGYKKFGILKHHLFGNQMEKWLTEIIPDIKMFQPDSGAIYLNNCILSNGENGKFNSHHLLDTDLLVICGNEVGDFMYEQIIAILNIDAHLELFSANLYLAVGITGDDLIGYQTIHGSADDKEDPDEIIPNATLRAAAAIAEDYLDIKDAKERVDDAITYTKVRSLQKQSDILEFVYKFLELEKVYLLCS